MDKFKGIFVKILKKICPKNIMKKKFLKPHIYKKIILFAFILTPLVNLAQPQSNCDKKILNISKTQNNKLKLSSNNTKYKKPIKRKIKKRKSPDQAKNVIKINSSSKIKTQNNKPQIKAAIKAKNKPITNLNDINLQDLINTQENLPEDIKIDDLMEKEESQQLDLKKMQEDLSDIKIDDLIDQDENESNLTKNQKDFAEEIKADDLIEPDEQSNLTKNQKISEETKIDDLMESEEQKDSTKNQEKVHEKVHEKIKANNVTTKEHVDLPEEIKIKDLIDSEEQNLEKQNETNITQDQETKENIKDLLEPEKQAELSTNIKEQDLEKQTETNITEDQETKDKIKDLLEPEKQTELSTNIKEQDLEKQKISDLEDEISSKEEEENFLSDKTIDSIIVKGNQTVPTGTILAKIPYKVGRRFSPLLSADIIKSLYGMGYFKNNIKILAEKVDENKVKIYIILEEKDTVDEYIFEGNKNLSISEIDKKINYSEMKNVDKNDIKIIINNILDLYANKDYHNVIADFQIIPVREGHIKVKFIINEGLRSIVKKVFFKGNKCFTSKKLRSIMFTREDWLFGFINKAGSYHPDAIEFDKQTIQDFYQSNGFLHAKIKDVILEEDPKGSCCYTITFVINEGDVYTINKISTEGTDLLCQEEILARIGICPGDLFSTKRIRQSIELLKLIWGDFGYIFANVDIIPEVDEDKKTVDLTFVTELGKSVFCNRINILGNCKTREGVIRREILINEGDLVTTRAMEESKEQVERLGYFDQKIGVNWKTNRVNEEKADLDLIVQEAKTGKLYAEIRTGGDTKNFQSPATSLQFGGGIKTINLWGTGIKASLSGHTSKQANDLAMSILNPWLFNRPLQGGLSFNYNSNQYDEFRLTREPPTEHDIAASALFGFTKIWWPGITNFIFNAGFENIKFDPIEPRFKASVPEECRRNLNEIILKTFKSGNVIWLGATLSQDYRNNPINPSRGYNWVSDLKLAIPHKTNGFGYIRWDTEANWYYPLINDHDLIFHLRAHAGIVQELGKKQFIPYKELYHLGGPASVRGFLWGEIGPTLFGEDSLGGKKAFWINAELIWPVTSDFNLIALAFYDGGASWDTPLADEIKCGLRNNNFNFRQAIGVGFKMRSPTPVSVAVGFKLDRNKRTGESISEIHFSSAVDF